MKKIIHTTKLLLLSIVCAATCGCKDFLTVEQLGKNDIPGFFSNIEGLRMSRLGMYSSMYSMFDGYYTKYPDVAADMIRVNIANASMWDQYIYDLLPEHTAGAEGAIYRTGYTLLANINNILAYAPDLREDYPQHAAEIDKIYCEALFARALTHLALCNTYAQPYNYTDDGSHAGIQIALKLAGPNEEIGRSSVAQVYSRILTDLTNAFSGLGEVIAPAGKTECYYVTARAVKALQARTCLYMGNYTLARDYATELINVMSLTPTANYVSMMQLWNDDSPGEESIFRLSGYGSDGHSMASYYHKSNNILTAVATDKLVDSFEYAQDVRKSLIKIDGEITKYSHPDLDPIPPEKAPENKDIPYGVHIFRLSEMYLIRAEAYCQLDNLPLAEADVKKIIARAVNKTPDEITLTYSGKEELMAIIDRERALELFGEGHRLFDIVRRKQDMKRDANNIAAGDVMPITMTYPNNKFVLPFPTHEIVANEALKQNPGY